MRKDGRLLKRDFVRFLRKKPERKFYAPLLSGVNLTSETCPIAIFLKESGHVAPSVQRRSYSVMGVRGRVYRNLPQWAQEFIHYADFHRRHDAGDFARMVE